MFYTRLTHIYHESTCNNYFREDLLKSFELFIIENKVKGNRYLNPYEFAMNNNLSIANSIKFFLYFTNDEGVLNMLAFFECSNSSCIGERIFFNIENREDILICEECNKQYLYDEIESFTKVYFQLKPDIDIPAVSENIVRSDPNSTISVLRGLPDNLKAESPSSYVEVRETDEGVSTNDPAVDIRLINELNVQNPSPINPHLRLQNKLIGRGR